MLKQQQMRKFFRRDRRPRRDANERSPRRTFAVWRATAFAVALGGLLALSNADLRAQNRPSSSDSKPASTQRSAYASAAKTSKTPSASAPDRSNLPTKNGRCVQKTFAAPDHADAALLGGYFSRLLPDSLRQETFWRYDEKSNSLTVYGPEAALNVVDELLTQFNRDDYEASVANQFQLVATAGFVEREDAPRRVAPTSAYEGRERRASNETYYDPERNDFVRVAYDADAAILPTPSEAIVFGSEVADENAPTLAPPLPGSAKAPVDASREDSALEIVSYRCLPTQVDKIEELARREFSSISEIAFSVDRQLGTIVVHTNRKLQRAVQKYFASLDIYPATLAPNQPDPRVATGVLRPIDGVDSTEPTGVRVARQAFGGSTPAPSFAAPAVSGSAADVYAPQYRKATELQDALIRLFGERFQKLDADATDAPQVATYRFVKRQTSAESEARACDVDFDAERNAISLDGDAALCSQMLVLLRAMDQPPPAAGVVRRFIPIRYGDSNKIRQIFESGATPAPVAPLGLNRGVGDFGRDLAQTDAVRRLSSTASTPFERFAPYFSNVAPAIPSLESALASNVPNAIRQVAYQEGDGGLSALGAPDAPLGGFGDFASPDENVRPGVGVVQDFVPIVLPELDVVIVDNATDAEFERIRQMIEQIEELAKIADPTIEVYMMKHVDGAMLHGVLTKLYAEMFATKQGRVMFYALQNPNAILVVGWGQAFDDMKNLIEVFDKPIAEGAGTLRVVRLKYASATEIAALLTDTFPTPLVDGTGGFAPRILVFTDVRTNSLVVQASPNDWLEIEKLLVELDVNTTAAKLVTRVFPLKNSLAEDILTTIQNAILPAKQGTLETDAAKFPVLELLSVDESGQRLIQSGVMMDVEVSADVYHNQLIVNAPEDCMEFMEKLIELLDVAPKKAEIRFFQVRHGDAQAIMQTLQSLLATSDDAVSTPTLPQAEGEETFVPVRFAIDTRTNVIIAAAAPRELAIVDALIVALDVQDATERVEEVVQLRNIRADVVASAIDDYLAQKQQLETLSEVLTTYQLYESQVIVIPESISNSIIVSASPEHIEKILEMIKTFDADPPQVVIQVLIAEVTLTDQEEFGIEAGLQDASSFNRSLITNAGSGGATGSPGFNIVNGGGPGENMNSTVAPTNIAGQVLNNFGMGASSSALGYGGFVLSASSRSVDVTLRALREKNRLQILSRPQITAMDNQQAFILVGQRVPRINGTSMTDYGVQMNTSDTPVGLILLVTPRVTKDGRVVMEIGAEKSSLGNDADAVPIFSQDGEVIKSQSIDTIQAMTAISARDGETVMLGGLLTSTKEKIGRGVPYLSDIPVLGWLFRYDQEREQRKELLIVMTPRILRTPEDFEEIVRVEVGKTNVNLSEAMEINGDMGLYDAATNQGRETKKTRNIVNDLVHPDQMNELQDIPEYDPSRDYQPRPQTPPTPATTQRVGANRVVPTSRTSTANRSSVARNAAESRRPAIPAVETERDDEPTFLLMDDDDLSERSTRRDDAVRSASAEKRSTAPRVARVETDAEKRSTARKPASEKTTETSRSTARKPASEKATETSRSTARKPASEKTTETSRSTARKPASEKAAVGDEEELPPLKNPRGFAFPWSRSNDEKSND